MSSRAWRGENSPGGAVSPWQSCCGNTFALPSDSPGSLIHSCAARCGQRRGVGRAHLLDAQCLVRPVAPVVRQRGRVGAGGGRPVPAGVDDVVAAADELGELLAEIGDGPGRVAVRDVQADALRTVDPRSQQALRDLTGRPPARVPRVDVDVVAGSRQVVHRARQRRRALVVEAVGRQGVRLEHDHGSGRAQSLHQLLDPGGVAVRARGRSARSRRTGGPPGSSSSHGWGSRRRRPPATRPVSCSRRGRRAGRRDPRSR